jgi:uncharacterized protein YcnI
VEAADARAHDDAMTRTTMRARLFHWTVATGLIVASVAALAHVTVAPRESQAGAEQRYTVRVPTEGDVATTSVELEIPADVTIIEVVAAADYSFEIRRDGQRIVAVTWTKSVPPGESATFVFAARNPRATQITWRAHQRLADGTSVDWIGEQADRRPAAITRLAPEP